MGLFDRLRDGKQAYEDYEKGQVAKSEANKKYNEGRKNVTPDIDEEFLADAQRIRELTGEGAHITFLGDTDSADHFRTRPRSVGGLDIDRVFDSVKKERQREGKESSDELDLSSMSRSERKALREAMGGSISRFDHLMALRPRERYVFHSDYYKIDDEYATILSFFHDDAASDEFYAFWGVNRIPHGIDAEVTTILMEQVRRMTDQWVDAEIANADKIDKLSEREISEGAARTTKRRAIKIASDMSYIVAEWQSGASYLSVQNRLMVKAPTLEKLDAAVEKIERLYIDRFHTLRVEAHHGQQRDELSTIFSENSKKLGKGFHFTSTEYAGSYSLVTNGLNDASGEYVGFMFGDVNNSAIFFDVDAWRSNVVCAHNQINRVPQLERSLYSDMWASKISQAALVNGHRVVHLVLNSAKLDVLGPRFDGLTARIDMTQGQVNMFELFGNPEDELQLFPIHIEKLKLMVEQTYGAQQDDKALPIIRNNLSDILNSFYIDQRMWAANAQHRRGDLRLVGLPHDQVPLLQVFSTYLDTRYEAIKRSEAKDENELHAVSVLRGVIRSMLENNGSLFNNPTSNMIDGVNAAQRVIYNFADLTERGNGVAMAQLINVVGFAVSALNEGDVVLIHGAEEIVNPQVQEFLANRIRVLREKKGVRVGMFYNSVTNMLANAHFNGFTGADYTVLGPMSADEVSWYQEQMRQSIPPALAGVITSDAQGMSYLRRGAKNVTFITDLALGINPNRKAGTMSTAASIEGDSARASTRGGGTADTSAMEHNEQVMFDLRAEADQSAHEKAISRSGAMAQMKKEEEQLRASREDALRLPDTEKPGTDPTTGSVQPASSPSSKPSVLPSQQQPAKKSWRDFQRT